MASMSVSSCSGLFVFFFQAEDGIRDRNVTGVQTCALPTSAARLPPSYLVVDSQTGYVLIEQNAREKLQVASLTKIATACVVLDWAEKKGGDLNQLATINEAEFVGVEKKDIGWQGGVVVS